jgi:hypothetical protein
MAVSAAEGEVFAPAALDEPDLVAVEVVAVLAAAVLAPELWVAAVLPADLELWPPATDLLFGSALLLPLLPPDALVRVVVLFLVGMGGFLSCR